MGDINPMEQILKSSVCNRNTVIGSMVVLWYANISVYQLWERIMTFIGKHIYEGDAVGIGITMGYSMALGKRFNLEFSAGFGAVHFWHQQYFENDNFEDYAINNPGKTNAHGYKLFPAKLAVSISYIIR